MAVIQQANTMQKILDPHLHFFDLSKGKYAWLKPQNPPFWPDKHIIARNMMPGQIVLNDRFNFVGGVHIEAGFDNGEPQKELHCLESDIYNLTPHFHFKSIAYINLLKSQNDFQLQMENLMISPTFVGVRCIFDDIMLDVSRQSKVLDNMKFLEKMGIIFEFQISVCDDVSTNALINLVSAVPELCVVINHAGLPPLSSLSSISIPGNTESSNKYGSSLWVSWKQNLAFFAKLPNCFIKCSGFEMQDRNYTREHVLKVISFVHTLFGNERLMLASNFPLTLLSTSYSHYWQLLHDCAESAGLSSEQLMYSNAKRIYGFDC